MEIFFLRLKLLILNLSFFWRMIDFDSEIYFVEEIWRFFLKIEAFDF